MVSANRNAGMPSRDKFWCSESCCVKTYRLFVANGNAMFFRFPLSILTIKWEVFRLYQIYLI